MEEFKKKYIEEAFEIIASLEEAILKLENDTNTETVVEEVFRSMHTLKGGAAMFGFENIRDITHELENAYDRIRNGEILISKPLLDITLESIDYFKQLLNDSEEQNNDPKYHDQLIERIGKVPEQNTTSEKQKPTREKTNTGQCTTTNTASAEQENNNTETQNSPEDKTLQTYYIYFRPHKDVLKNGTNPLLLIDELNNTGTCKAYSFILNTPNIHELAFDELHMGWHIVLAVKKEQKDAISDVFIFIEDDADIEIHEISNINLFNNNEIWNEIDNLLRSNNKAMYSELQKISGVLNTGQQTTSIEHNQKTTEELSKENTKKQPIQETPLSETENKISFDSRKKNSIQSLRISAEKVDELMNLVSELVTTQARLKLFTEKHTTPGLEAISENIQKLTSRLRDNAFDLSLIPLQSIVTRFQRMVRDLSAELGKEIVFNTRGTETELDKSIIENLTDPILHILRNSIDHGIEDNETRTKQGKPKKGEILLKAYYSGANVYIEISDDGRGIDPENIRKNAIEKGLIGNDTKLSKNELFDLVFVSGFSTTNNVTEVSGRGVGMDVVQDKISEIRGEVEIDSTLGRGTTITIKLPLTLSIIDGLLANVGNTSYIIPLNVVDKIYMIRQHQMSETFYNTLTLSGQQVPYYSLRDEFHNGEKQPEKQQVIIVSFEDKQLGIVVDKVIGEYQAVLKPLGKHYRKMQIFSGGTILGDGTVALVMDTNKMIKKFSNQQKQEVYHGE